MQESICKLIVQVFFPSWQEIFGSRFKCNIIAGARVQLTIFTVSVTLTRSICKTMSSMQ